MNFLVVGVVRNSQVTRLREEAQKKGHVLDACFVTDLDILADGSRFVPKIGDKDLTDYDVVYLLTLGKRRWVWYAVSEYLKKKGVVIVNSAVVDSAFNFNINVTKEYLLNSENNIPYPKSFVLLSSKSVENINKHFEFPFILKSGEGRQGKSVYKILNKNELNQRVVDMQKDNLTIVAREFIPNDGDIRVFTVGYKAIGAMKRNPKEGEFKSNISRGGTGEMFELDNYPDISKLAENAAEVNRVEIAGVDVIIHKETGKACVLEVNPGPQFTGLEKYTRVNAAGEIIQYFESLVH